MAYKKGQSGNPKGKPKGAVSKKTAIWKEMGEWFANDGIETYKKNLIKLMNSDDEKTRMLAMSRFESLLEYFKPKLSRTDIKQDVKSAVKIEVIKTYDSNVSK